MSSLNVAQIIGNLGRDPEMRHTNDGKPVCNLNVATTDTWKDRDSGERREKTEWHRCTLWGPLADIAAKHLAKGSKVFLQGKLETRKWQDQSGQDRYTTEIVLRGFDAKLVMLDGPRSGGGGGEDTGMYDQQPTTNEMDDEIPFIRR